MLTWVIYIKIGLLLKQQIGRIFVLYAVLAGSEDNILFTTESSMADMTVESFGASNGATKRPEV
jgi:hypothetical protein